MSDYRKEIVDKTFLVRDECVGRKSMPALKEAPSLFPDYFRQTATAHNLLKFQGKKPIWRYR